MMWLCAWLACAHALGCQPPLLRVGTSGDYAPFSITEGSPGASGEPSGFDPALARAYARDRGLRIRWVRFRWPELTEDLRADRFDVAMSGVTVRPERSLAGRFTVPVATSGAVVLARGADRWKDLAALDRPGVELAVNSGGHLEKVARARFRRASLIALTDNDAVRAALWSGRVDAVLTDTLEAPGWSRGRSDIARFGPFTRDRKAYLVGANRAELAADLDGWLMAREEDGFLTRLRLEHFAAAAGGPTAEPLTAVLAAIDERLSLMPLVAEAKRRSGTPVAVPEREERVIDAAMAVFEGQQVGSALSPQREDRLRALFRAQIEAAKAIQRAVLAASPDPSLPVLALESELRPALTRLSERVAGLLPRLPPDLTQQSLRAQARDALRGPGLEESHVLAIADALLALAQTPVANAGALRQ